MVLLENDSFLTELTKMFHNARTKGSVTVTMKRYDGKSKPEPKKTTEKTRKKSDSFENMCLMRAKLDREKISTVVHAKDVNRFQQAYCNLMRANMDGLKKLKKSKTRAKALKATG